VRKNKFVEILPINVGCLGACTYCKTKHARGHLGSYMIDSLVSSWHGCSLFIWIRFRFYMKFNAAGRACKYCNSWWS